MLHVRNKKMHTVNKVEYLVLFAEEENKKFKKHWSKLELASGVIGAIVAVISATIAFSATGERGAAVWSFIAGYALVGGMVWLILKKLAGNRIEESANKIAMEVSNSDIPIEQFEELRDRLKKIKWERDDLEPKINELLNRIFH